VELLRARGTALTQKAQAKDRVIVELREGSKILEDQLRLMDAKYVELRSKLDYSRARAAREVGAARKAASTLRMKWTALSSDCGVPGLAGTLLDEVELPQALQQQQQQQQQQYQSSSSRSSTANGVSPPLPGPTSPVTGPGTGVQRRRPTASQQQQQQQQQLQQQQQGGQLLLSSPQQWATPAAQLGSAGSSSSAVMQQGSLFAGKLKAGAIQMYS
jgi:hypothetical protein